jgi:hypothetical protein
MSSCGARFVESDEQPQEDYMKLLPIAAVIAAFTNQLRNEHSRLLIAVTAE